jgi:hypothetical protein
MSELFCPVHGPYDASYGTCPYCAGILQRPDVPAPLSDEDAPTDINPIPVGGAGYQAGQDENDPTQLGAERRGNAGFLDDDDVDPTELGNFARVDDVTEIEFVETGIVGLLWVKEGQRRGRIYKIKDGTIIGRSEGDLVMDDPKVSNPHAKLKVEDDKFVIWDFASHNGTYVNGERIRAATELKENDLIKIGDTVFILKVLE